MAETKKTGRTPRQCSKGKQEKGLIINCKKTELNDCRQEEQDASYKLKKIKQLQKFKYLGSILKTTGNVT